MISRTGGRRRFAKATAIVAGLASLLAADVRAESVPKDCSEKAAADVPVALRIDGQKQPLPIAKLRLQQGMSVDEESFDVFNLALRDADSLFAPREVSISLLMVKGEPPDGKTFRLLPLPTSDMEKQPTPVKSKGAWLPEVQSLEVKSEPDGIEYEHGVIASMRVEFGKRSDTTLPGKVVVCITPGQKDDVFLPEPTRAIVVEGRFDATLE